MRERVFQVIAVAEYAREIGAGYINGSTGVGNDQVRLTCSISSASDAVITPIRDNKLSREEEIEYLKNTGGNRRRRRHIPSTKAFKRPRGVVSLCTAQHEGQFDQITARRASRHLAAQGDELAHAGGDVLAPVVTNRNCRRRSSPGVSTAFRLPPPKGLAQREPE